MLITHTLLNIHRIIKNKNKIHLFFGSAILTPVTTNKTPHRSVAGYQWPHRYVPALYKWAHLHDLLSVSVDLGSCYYHILIAVQVVCEMSRTREVFFSQLDLQRLLPNFNDFGWVYSFSPTLSKSWDHVRSQFLMTLIELLIFYSLSRALDHVSSLPRTLCWLPIHVCSTEYAWSTSCLLFPSYLSDLTLHLDSSAPPLCHEPYALCMLGPKHLFFLCCSFCLEFSASWILTHSVNHCI